jgi:hypothetical protein
MSEDETLYLKILDAADQEAIEDRTASIKREAVRRAVDHSFGGLARIESAYENKDGTAYIHGRRQRNSASTEEIPFTVSLSPEEFKRLQKEVAGKPPESTPIIESG